MNYTNNNKTMNKLEQIKQFLLSKQASLQVAEINSIISLLDEAIKDDNKKK